MKDIVSVDHLRVEFATDGGTVVGVEDMSFAIAPSETLCVVGESGSGKSVTSLSLMRLVEFGGGKITKGALNFVRVDGARQCEFLFEGQEEIGSSYLPPFIKANGALLKTDMIFSADGSQRGEDQPNLITGLKGLVAAQITVTGPKGDQLSGQQGRGIANRIQGLSHLIPLMKGLGCKIKVAGFYDDVVDLTVEDRAAFARVPFDEAQYVADLGVPAVFGEEGYTTGERLWARSTFALNGIWGGWHGNGIKTVLPAQAFAKITCRLVANQKPDTIFALLKAHIEAHCPPGLRMQVDRLAGSADPFLVPAGHNTSTTAAEVLAEVYGKAPYVTRTGGSIPVMTLLLNELGVHATVFAFRMNDENLHAPNEFFRLSNFRIGQTAYCKLLERLG